MARTTTSAPIVGDVPACVERLRTASAAVLLTAGLAACSSGSDTAGEGSRSATTSQSPSATSPPSETTSPTESSSGGASDSASPSAAAEGQLAGAGYSFTLPDGWQDATAQFKKYSELIDAGAVNAAQSGQAFSDNVNVLRNDDQAELPVAQAERQFADELRTVASRVQVQPQATVDDVDAIHLTGRTDAGGVTALTDQYITFVDGAYYIVTFSYGAATPAGQREQEVSSMLASWTWG